jgi:exopolyphosphatase / guanosine-5'-triphosphate,3'-diphosphate pyrophosphatase
LAQTSPASVSAAPGSHAARGAYGVRRSRGAPLGPYAALDLGTNNCRLLIARPTFDGFRVIDAFSRIVRLGEGLSQTGRLSEAAISRTLGALAICRDKMQSRGVARARLIATEACRAASNGAAFISEVWERLGLRLEIVDRETEAQLAVAGCGVLADQDAHSIVLFDIGGGSSEIIWLACEKTDKGRGKRIKAWESLRLGVVSLAEKFGGNEVSEQVFAAMTAHVASELAPFATRVASQTRCAKFHLLGTSGTVTTIGGVHLNLERYDRRRIDGLWLTKDEVDCAVNRLRAMSYAERAANACIGHERADLVLAGCAILEAIRQSFPAERIRIADRGLREGILTQMMSADRVGMHAGRVGV